MYATKGIVLSQKERGEADLLVAIFSERYGLLKATAQGVRKPAAKLSGHIEPGTEVEIAFVEGKSGYRLTGSELTDDFSRLREDEDRLRAFFAAAVVLETVSFEGEEQEVWNLFYSLAHWLDSQEVLSAREIQLGAVWFFVKFLLILGYQISQDFHSGREIRLLANLLNMEAAGLEHALGLAITSQDIESMFLAIRTSFEAHFGYRFLFLTASFKT